MILAPESISCMALRSGLILRVKESRLGNLQQPPLIRHGKSLLRLDCNARTLAAHNSRLARGFPKIVVEQPLTFGLQSPVCPIIKSAITLKAEVHFVETWAVWRFAGC